ncbi:hypothetical protein F2Q70_00036549 [Brassica cretica]|uniref:MYB-CC type transcription factor LHEQLE-containing domain-containing protein n=1 Tax=Brassica cretica TaxID=69181 RepID=A0A8S9JWM9_BRACR|nr:hypothetical protein F2Q70_00036549 [Brassica cretica]
MVSLDSPFSLKAPNGGRGFDIISGAELKCGICDSCGLQDNFLCWGESGHRFIFIVITENGSAGAERGLPSHGSSARSDGSPKKAARAIGGYSNLLIDILAWQVQRRLQLRIEAQGKYLQSILEKACKAFDDQAAAFVGLEAAREELSELAIKVSNSSQGTAVPFFDTTKMMMMPSVSELAVAVDTKNNITTNCSVESSLTSNTNGSSLSAASMKKRLRGDDVGLGYEAGWIMPSSSTIG